MQLVFKASDWIISEPTVATAQTFPFTGGKVTAITVTLNVSGGPYVATTTVTVFGGG